MTYEEARGEILRIAGDYKETRNLYRIKVSILEKEAVQFKEDITKTIESLSVSPETLQFSITTSDQLRVQVPEYANTRYDSVFNRFMRAEKVEDIVGYLEDSIKSLIGDMCGRSIPKLRDIQRVCGYGSLAMSSITDDLASSLLDKGSQLRVALHNVGLENNNYWGYCREIEEAMTKAACYWTATLMTLKPGMRISVRDLRTSGTSEATKVRTIKRVSYSDGEPIIYFADTASVLRGKSRIHELETYVLNTPEMFEIAETLKLKRLESIL